MLNLLKSRENIFSICCMLFFVSSVLLVRLALGMEFPIPWNDETAFISQAFEFSRTGSFYVYGLNSDRVVMWMPPGFMLLLAGVYKVFGYSFEMSRWVSSVLYLGLGMVALLVVRASLCGWRRQLGILLMLVAFLSPYALVIANVGRMESLYSLLFMLSLLAALKRQYVLGLALVLFSATVHFNAVYFLLPYAVLVGWKIVRRESLTVGSWELLALVLAAVALGGYGLFVLKNIAGFLEDMRFQFAFKLGSSVMGGASGWTLLAVCFCIPAFQLAVHRRFATEVLLSLYGIAFIAMALNGHSMWYYCAFNFGFWLLILGILASGNVLARPITRGASLVVALLLFGQLCYYGYRSTPELDPLKPSLGKFARDFLPEGEIDKVRAFVRALPPGTTVSFGYSGVEPYFFADFAKSGALWTGSAHSVTQVFPARAVDYRVLCDSVMFPAYLSIYDWDGFPRKSQDSGCNITRLSKEDKREP